MRTAGQTKQRRMRYFVVLSGVVHALFGLLWISYARPVLQLPAPQLALILSPSATHASARVNNSRATVPVAVMTQADMRHPSNDAADTIDSSRQTSDSAEHGQQQRRNHLQSLLSAALDAYFVYPPLARRHGWQGRVEVALCVDAEGRFSQLRVLRSSGYASLDQDALQTLERIGQLRQAPLLEGEAIQVQLPVVYRLLEG